MAPAAVLTLVRLTDPVFGLGIMLQAFTPYAVVPYGLALLVLGWGALRGRRHPVLLVPTGLALVGLLLHAAWFAPLLVGAERTPARAAAEVRVMTANLYLGRADAAAVVRYAAQDGVDVLVLTEVTVESVAAMERAGVRQVLPYRTGRPGPADSNTATMVFARTPVSTREALPATTFDNLLVATGDLVLLAAHPAAPLDPVAWREDHAAVLRAVTLAAPDVLAGDLNATLDHRPVRALEDAGLRDSAELANAGLQATWPVHGGFPVLDRLPPTTALDHVMVSEAWAVLGTHRVDVPGSDHLAVVATLARAA